MTSSDIREREAKYRAAIETSGDGFCISDMAGRFLEFNDAYVSLTGYSREELLNMSIPDIEAQQTAAEIAATLEKAICEGHAIFETKHRSKDGRVWPAEVNLSYWPIAGGRMFVFLRDITERKRAEEVLRESEERYRSIFLESHAVMLLIDPETGAIMDANSAASSYYGYTKEELTAKLITDINILPADQVMAEMQRARSGECRQFMFQHRLADGKVQDVEVFSGPIHFHRKILLHSIVHDISARRTAEEALRESEEKYRGLIETTNTGYVIVDTEGKVFDANPEYVRLTGYTELKEILGRSVIEWTAEQDRGKNTVALKHCLQTGPVKLLELDYAGRDGRSTPVEINATAISTSEGVKFLSLVRDISDRKRIEDEKAKLEAYLVQAQKMEAIGTLAGGIAHDFNNILTAIIGNISLAMSDLQMKQESRERLTEAEKACLQAQRLSQQLLTFSRGGAPIKEVVSVKSLIIESASFAWRGSQVNYEPSLPNNLWVVEADRGQLSQVFHNLMINAIQAMPTGGMIKIRGENLVVVAGSELPLSPGRYVKLSFQDQGMGIAKDYLPKIFDPYFTTKQKGSGLGLATSYSIIKNHRGYIAVESIFGKGTTFKVYLPASDRKVIQQPREDRELLSGKGKILIMDDEMMVRDVLDQMLVKLGYEVKFAGDGAEAIELFNQSEKSGNPFAAVILDLTVPGGMGGKETMARLLKINPQVRAIVSSGYANDPIMAELQKYGFTAVITKPYGVVELSNILQKVIGKRAN